MVLEAVLVFISLFATNHRTLERFSIFVRKSIGRATHPGQELLLLQTIGQRVSRQLSVAEKLMKLSLSAKETLGWFINVQLSHVVAVGEIESAPFGVGCWHTTTGLHWQNVSSGKIMFHFSWRSWH